MPFSRRDSGIAPSVSSRMTRGSLSWTGHGRFDGSAFASPWPPCSCRGSRPTPTTFLRHSCLNGSIGSPSRGKRGTCLVPPWVGSRERPALSILSPTQFQARTRNENRLRTRFVWPPTLLPATSSGARRPTTGDTSKSRPSRLSVRPSPITFPARAAISRSRKASRGSLRSAA